MIEVLHVARQQDRYGWCCVAFACVCIRAQLDLIVMNGRQDGGAGCPVPETETWNPKSLGQLNTQKRSIR